MSEPHKCPVCGGTGNVPAGFYNSVSGVPYSTSSASPDICRSCDGKGIIWRAELKELER